MVLFFGFQGKNACTYISTHCKYLGFAKNRPTVEYGITKTKVTVATLQRASTDATLELEIRENNTAKVFDFMRIPLG